MVKLFVHLLLWRHFAQVGISSPSNTSSRMNRSRQDSSLQRDNDGNETLKSQNGSNVTLVLPQVVHRNVLFNWPTKRSRMSEFSCRAYHSHVRSAFLLSLKKQEYILYTYTICGKSLSHSPEVIVDFQVFPLHARI